MKIILDTNIYLNFYRLNGGQSLEMIKSLNELLEKDKFKLVLPKQIEDEFIKNKNSSSAIYTDHILNFEKGLGVEFKIPYLIKSSPKIEQIKNTVKRLNGLKEKAVEDYKNRVFNPRSKINQQLRKLFSYAIRPTESDLILQRAYYRTLRGNPPRKGNSSFGDAIIWETILDQCIDDDLILISGDGDFENEIKSGEINEFLNEEWTRKSEKKLTLYTELGSFINKQSNKRKKPIKEETIHEEDQINTILGSSVYTVEPDVVYNGVNIVAPTLIASDSDVLYATSALSLGKNKCTCCGAEIGSTDSVYGLGNYRCKNCHNSLSPGLTCGQCGRHFHRDMIGVTTALINDSRCDECQGLV